MHYEWSYNVMRAVAGVHIRYRVGSGEVRESRESLVSRWPLKGSLRKNKPFDGLKQRWVCTTAQLDEQQCSGSGKLSAGSGSFYRRAVSECELMVRPAYRDLNINTPQGNTETRWPHQRYQGKPKAAMKTIYTCGVNGSFQPEFLPGLNSDMH